MNDHVTHQHWNKWKWRSVLAYAALAAANAFGFWMLTQEREDRVDQAAAVIYVRCLDSRANRLALRQALAANREQAQRLNRAGSVRRLDALIATLPPIQNCRAQAQRIRRLVD